MSITINIDKAREISHSIRRAARASEFAPLDAIIANQIPGQDPAQAEASRADIRSRHEAIQIQIDSAQTADDLKALVDGLKA